VNALYSNDHVFEVTADYVSISGFTVECATGGGEAGIYLDSNIDHCNIYDNNASGNYYGIYLSRSSNNTITSNTVSNNDRDGIELWVSSNNAITSNIAFNNTCGISLYSSNSNRISDNTASSNSYGISLSPAIGGPPSSDNKVTNNIASNNDYDGIRLSYSSDNTLTNNIASNNYGYGINLDESNNNRVYNNYFDNTNNAWDDGNNIWNITKIAGPNIIGGSWRGGNYWSDYDGIDTNGDGLGDTMLPYNSNGNILISGDKHPLVPAGIAPRLSIEKSDNPDSVQPGGTLNYFINLSNTGYINATNAIVTETYDDNVTFVSAIPAPSEGDDTWIFSALNANETKWINISVSVNPSTPIGTILHNIVTVSCAEGFTDSDTEVTTVLSGEPNCTCGDICVITTGWWRDGGAFNPSDSPIQDAIDNAITSDTICVKDGEYNENVDVHTRLTIRSENGATSTIVNALYPKDHVFEVTADYVTISGFTVKGATGILKAGIYLDSYIDHCNIYDNKASNNSNGIYLPESSNYNSISSNIAVDNGNGICISSSSGNKIYNNSASSNTYGIRLSSSSDNKITSNTASSNYYGIPLLESNNNTISSNNVFDSNSGISLSSSSSNRISNNSASNNNYGGICLYSSSDNKIANNSASSNNYGIRLDESNNNLIYNNYFDNTNNAWDDGNNVWNIAKTAGTNIIYGSWLGGNYWSDYEGIDANGDGLGDTLLPYNSNGDILIGGDMHPLVTVGYGPLLSIEKSDDPDPVQSGGRLNYSILVNNVGYIATTNVRVIETYDVSVTYESAIPVPSEGNGTWIFPSVNANETRRINISVTVKPSTPIGTVLYNIVNVTCDEGVADSDTEATTVFS
ncbi:MAG: right-handed parallel beta-helix repeat-containing protein, partial [Methanophagales archaeon]|nr:right-handed parallel beta-helix repeat-containing protein [Methanophagales archaeon]